MNPDPELLATQVEQQSATDPLNAQLRQASRERRQLATRRRRPVLDKLVAATLILAWLLMATADTYVPLGPMLLLWAGQGWGLDWLWRQYREHTAPSQFDRPRPAAKPAIPLLVRLLLLPGISRWAGPTLTSKARAIRFYRTDMHRRTAAARKAERWHTFSRATGTIPIDHRDSELYRLGLDIPPRTSWERSMQGWAARNPGRCGHTVHLFTFAQGRCRCDQWHWSSLPDVRTM